MDRDYFEVNVYCPFYLGETRNAVRCEGIEGAASVHVVCGTPAAKRAYEEAHCCTAEGNEACPVWRMLMEKYDTADSR